MRISFLIIIMTLTTATASADKYSRAWKKVEKFMNEDLPESAAKEINHIWDMAARDGDGRQMLKSAAYLTQVQQSYTENSLIEGIDLFNTLLPKLSVSEHKALCHAFLAKGYIRYWELNKYRARRIPSDEPNPPLQRWTPQMICDTICYHLDQSINLAGDVASGYYEEFFPGGNKAGQKLRPNLVDMLMDNAMVLVTDYRFTYGKRSFLDDSRLYGTMQDFLNATRNLKADDPDLWQFYVLHRLIEHNMRSKPNIQCTIDIRRMQVLNEYLENDGGWTRNDEEWLKGAVSLAQSYSKKVKFSTLLYSMAARKIQDNMWQEMPEEKAISLKRQARDICYAAQKKWPKSEGARECLAIRDEIERRNVNIVLDQDFVPGERNIAKLNYTNVNTVYFKVVEVPGRFTSIQDEITLLSQLNQSNAVAEWSMRVNDPADYLEHSAFVSIPPVMQGCYYLMAATSAYFSSGDCIAYQYMECNGIRFLKLAQKNGALYGTAIDTRTGKPVPDCKYTLWRLNSQNEQVKMLNSGITGPDGFILIEGLNPDGYKIELEAAGSKGNASFNMPWNSDMPARDYVKLLFDRRTYLPGDSILFSGVAYRCDNEIGHVYGGVPVRLRVSTTSGDDDYLGPFMTDSMGVFRGSYHIPQEAMPGTMRIGSRICETEDEDAEGYAYSNYQTIMVESFRQPRFEVLMENRLDEAVYDKPVTVKGRVVTYTGMPVDDADVEWYAGVGSYSCHRFCIPDEMGDIRVGADRIKTDSAGCFSFTVTIPSDIMVDESCWCDIEVTVTDVNGETQDANFGFNARNEFSRDIWVEAAGSLINAAGENTLRFVLNGNNGAISGRINVKVTRIARLEQPGLPLPFNINVGKEKRELSVIADNQNLRERYPLYDFDFNEANIVETTVFEGVVPYDKDDYEASKLTLSGLQSGEYRVTASAEGCKTIVRDFVFCREDDYSYVPPKPLVWSTLDDNYNSSSPNCVVEIGDTLNIRVGNSRKGTLIHYIIENRYGAYGRGTIESNGRQQTLSIPVTEELTGFFAVHMSALYEGVSENKSFIFEVPDRVRQLKFELITFRDITEPGLDEEWKLRITDWQGNPVQAAVLIDMYDRALTAYGGNYFRFNPFSPVWMSSRTLLDNQYKYALQYYPWAHVFGNPYEYKGKRAVTGTLIDPFGYNSDKRLARGGKKMLKNASAQVETLDMVEFEDLGITTVDEALQGRVGGLDIVFDSSDTPQRQMERVAQEQESSVALRSDMNPTGLFDYVQTDTNGLAAVRFKAPQLLTTWLIQGIALTDRLKTGRLDTTLVTRKQLMVEPSAPRFLREGDRMEFTAKVNNMTQNAVKADVILTLSDAVTGKALAIIEGPYKKNVTIPAGGSAGVGFSIKVPSGLTAVTYRLTAQTKSHSDGMQQTIPVLSNRTQVTQALSLFNNGTEKREFRFEDLEKPRSATMAQEQLTLEYSATPIWYAIQALPSMIRVDDPSNLRLFHSYMGAAISQNLSDRYPAIRQMLDEWAALPASEWETQLERNQKLTATLLEETPWLRSSNSERDRLHALASALDTEQIAETLTQALRNIMSTQNYDGGWGWLPELPSSVHITDEILQGLGLLLENGVVQETSDIKSIIRLGLRYLDGQFYKEYDVKEKPQTLSYSQLSYLLTRSYFASYEFRDQTRASHTYFTRLAQIQDTHDMNLYFRAQLALLMSRTGHKADAERIAATLVERSLYSDEMGRYWRDNVGGLLWHEAPIETQALIIRTLLATGHRTEAVEAARWLLKQRQTTGWCSSPATAAAVTALMATGAGVQLDSDPDITIYVGKDAVKASDSKATAGYTTRVWDGPITRDKATITVDSKTPGISWGAVYRTFTEDLDKVEHTENGMQLTRTIWHVVHSAAGDRLEEVKPGTILHVGDRLRVQFNLVTDRNLEYLQLSDMRAATVEPASTAAGYRYNWKDDIGYYTAPGNTRNVFYIDRLSKGSYVIEYDVVVQKPGRFTVGTAVMQCMYAPAFRATTASATLTVE